MKNILTRVLIPVFLVAPALARQTPRGKATTEVKREAAQRRSQSGERRGAITGRVVDEGNRPLAHIGVSVFQAGLSGTTNRREAGTDEDGRFRVDDLAAAAYSIRPYAPGYVRSATSDSRQYYRIGDAATLTMMKGAVITGTVRNAAGEPMVNVPVRCVRVRDAEGRPPRAAFYGRDFFTDDRGVYRAYGLEPGIYVVVAGGSAQFSYTPVNQYAGDAPTYYPSSTRDTAVEVMAQAGQEATGIDITYRGEKGHAVSGSVSGAISSSTNSGVTLNLVHAASGAVEAVTSVYSREDNRGFAFYGVPDGEYILTAWQYFGGLAQERDGAASQPRRVVVKGSDVTGLEVALAPLGSISGRLALEMLPEADARAKCKTQAGLALEEVILSARRDGKDEAYESQWLRLGVATAVDDKGEFAARNLREGRYWLEADLPNENWYVKSIALPGGAGNLRVAEVASKGIALKTGERVTGLTVTIAEGAAGLKGRVVPKSEGEALPARLRVHVVPAERERANEVLRYAQADVQGDGSFSFKNLAPGKYWLLARVATDEE
ncbi:MAG TPA: carboxypeptidase-like regulatory domain-containing protein, partial [Blastocatellia bacterium]|nr:carboxypeptidase-like regulatory domain-containing protein [Blastocatellia bacterium]